MAPELFVDDADDADSFEAYKLRPFLFTKESDIYAFSMMMLEVCEVITSNQLE